MANDEGETSQIPMSVEERMGRIERLVEGLVATLPPLQQAPLEPPVASEQPTPVLPLQLSEVPLAPSFLYQAPSQPTAPPNQYTTHPPPPYVSQYSQYAPPPLIPTGQSVVGLTNQQQPQQGSDGSFPHPPEEPQQYAARPPVYPPPPLPEHPAPPQGVYPPPQQPNNQGLPQPAYQGYPAPGHQPYPQPGYGYPAPPLGYEQQAFPPPDYGYGYPIPLQPAYLAQSSEPWIKQFQKMRPPTFDGDMDPNKADAWTLSMEKIFKVLRCSEEQKVVLATHNLEGEAYRWWMVVEQMEAGMSWRRFLVVFNDKYFPQSMKDAKCAEFLQLTQKEGMTVRDYDREFTLLARFAAHVVGDEYQKARKFENGLQSSLKKFVKIGKLATYAEVYDRAMMLEQEDNEERKNLSANKRENSGNGGYNNRNVGGSNQASYKRQNIGIGGENSNSGQNPNHNQGRATTSRCNKCGNIHFGICYLQRNTCFYCGQDGHLRKDCPSLGAENVPVIRNNIVRPVNASPAPGAIGKGMQGGNAQRRAVQGKTLL